MVLIGRRIEQALGVGALLLLAIGCTLVLWPFLSAILWAVVICFSTWPVYRWCERAVGGYRAAAAAATTMLLLGCLTFALSFVPGGPPFLWGPVALWLLTQGSIGWGIFVAIWGLLLVSSIDNFLRPYLLNQNTNLPVLLALFGLIGGVLAFGLIGLFLGPTLLEVAYNLFLEWIAAELEERKQPASPLPASDQRLGSEPKT